MKEITLRSIQAVNIDELRELATTLLTEHLSTIPRESLHVKVRFNPSARGSGVVGFYDVIVVDEDHQEHTLTFRTRGAKAIYIYLLTRQKPLRRRDITPQLLHRLFMIIYKTTSTIDGKDEEGMNRLLNQAFRDTRNATRAFGPTVTIADPKSNNGHLFIPLSISHPDQITVADELKV